MKQCLLISLLVSLFSAIAAAISFDLVYTNTSKPDLDTLLPLFVSAAILILNLSKVALTFFIERTRVGREHDVIVVVSKHVIIPGEEAIEFDVEANAMELIGISDLENPMDQNQIASLSVEKAIDQQDSHEDNSHRTALLCKANG